MEVTSKWKQLGDLALASNQMEMAENCMRRAKDLGGLLRASIAPPPVCDLAGLFSL